MLISVLIIFVVGLVAYALPHILLAVLLIICGIWEYAIDNIKNGRAENPKKHRKKKMYLYELPKDTEEQVVSEEFIQDCRRVARKYQKSGKDSESTEFDVEMILKQIEEYGKYKGILKCDNKRCERYLPVSVAKQIVRARGVGGICGYLEENK